MKTLGNTFDLAAIIFALSLYFGFIIFMAGKYLLLATELSYQLAPVLI